MWRGAFSLWGASRLFQYADGARELKGAADICLSANYIVMLCVYERRMNAVSRMCLCAYSRLLCACA